MKLLSLVLQFAGCVVLCVGAFVLFGTGIGLAVTGVVAVAAGAVLEREAS